MDRRLLLGVVPLIFLTGCGQMAAPPSSETASNSGAADFEPVPADETRPSGETEPADLEATDPEPAGTEPPDPVLTLAPPDMPEVDPVGELGPMSEHQIPDRSAADELPQMIGELVPVPPVPVPSVPVPPISERPAPLPLTAPQTRSPAGGAASPSPPPIDKGFTRVRVFYGTDRRRGDTTPNEFYNDQRGSEEAASALELGHCDVSIPYKHAPGEIERPSVWRFEFRELPAKHVMLLDVQPLDHARWQTGVREQLNESADRVAMVFVHGFNVDFASAARRTAQMKYDLGFPGAAILYSWPAPNNYVECEGNATWTLPHLMEFLTEHVQKSGAQSIHLIAHSMGTRVLTTALKELAASPAAAHVRYNQIILAAPDIDAAVFKRQIAPQIVTAADRISIYSSSKDWALVASKKVHRYTRLGEAGESLTTFPEWPQIEVLDASTVDESLLGHSYYGDSPTILRDVRGVLEGIGAAARGLRAQTNYYLFSSKRTLLSDRPR